MQRKLLLVALGWMLIIQVGCGKKGGGGDPDPDPPDPPGPPEVLTNDVDYYLTRGDQTVLLQKQGGTIGFSATANSNADITVDSITKYQTVDGFGYTLTSGSATLINGLAVDIKTATLQELFGANVNSIGVSYLRISIGASDMSANVYSYDDMPTGQTDPTLANFSIDAEQSTGTGLIPVLKAILAINPNVRILGSPWSPPVWMKDNGSSIGGSLKPSNYAVYAQYFVKYVQAMQAEGIHIDAITPQNEPLNPGNNPSLQMTWDQQADFIKNHLGPAFQTAGLTTKIIVWDHNCDNPSYPISILSDAAAKPYVDGSAFHLYSGDISALTTVHNQFPDKNLYFTEQYTPSNGSFDGDLVWHMKNVIIGSMRNWSKNALEWNLANDPTFGPHTTGGCTTCKGALTLSGSVSVTRNVSFYIIGQIAKFVPQGSIRIASTNATDLSSVAFERPDKKKVLVVLNESTSTTRTFNIKYKGKWAVTSLPPKSAGTYIW